MTELEPIRSAVFDGKTIEEKLFNFEKLRLFQSKIKEFQKDLELEIIDDLKTAGLSGKIMGETFYCVGEKKTNRFLSDKIIGHLQSDAPEIRACAIRALPKNPDWKSTKIKELQELTKEELFYQDVQDVLELKAIPKYLLKGDKK